MYILKQLNEVPTLGHAYTKSLSLVCQDHYLATHLHPLWRWLNLLPLMF
jgi:hypothetical protein